MSTQILCNLGASGDVSEVRRYRFRRHVARLAEARARGDIAAGEAAIAAFKQQHGKPVTEAERWSLRIEALLANPPYLHDGEREFLVSMSRQLDGSGKEPTERQAAWIAKIEGRR